MTPWMFPSPAFLSPFAGSIPPPVVPPAGIFLAEGAALPRRSAPAPARERAGLGAEECIPAGVSERAALPVVCRPAAFLVVLGGLLACVAARCVMHGLAPRVSRVSAWFRALGFRLVLSNRSPCRWLVPARWGALRVAEVEALFGLRPALSLRDVWAGPAPIRD